MIPWPRAVFPARPLQPWLGVDAIWWSFPVSAACAMLLSLAYYRWGRWRQAHMLAPEKHSVHEVAVPAEVPATPPSPVADPAGEADS